MKQRLYKIVYITAFFLLFACINKNVNSYKDVPYTGNSNISFNSISMDTISIDGSKTSLVGRWSCLDDKLIFGDFYYGSFYIYDTNFNFKNKVLSRGRGPNEIPSKKWVDYTVHDDQIFIIGSSYDYYIVNNRTWKKEKSSRLNFSNESTNIKKLFNDPKPHYLGLYEVNYPGLNLSFLNSGKLLFSISTTHPKVNAYTSRVFYDEFNTIATLDLKNNKIENMFCNYSPIYQDYEYIPQFSNVLFTKSKDELLFSFEADSLIYRAKEDNIITSKYGNKGRNISAEYPEVTTTDNYVGVYKTDRAQFGYYKYLKSIPDTGILFRGYQKDKPSKMDGLQVYRDNNLIGDVNVPIGFRIIGYIEPYYYAQLPPDDLKEEFTLFKFKLDNQ
ncbi:hypothetical protein [Flavivirga spongiicola]|uniref:DUF4221 domain-containing protein n=1 Tax=Flavivirga spongiicola TaxID=421621 RepID=A0ABU7XU37_9FLAO|nr:hypothetical protein [Flavivirga sp. MEBiC05379]MDO5978347.1 hypothetical protein [Flavivirga sp. MEBiC05379]